MDIKFNKTVVQPAIDSEHPLNTSRNASPDILDTLREQLNSEVIDSAIKTLGFSHYDSFESNGVQHRRYHNETHDTVAICCNSLTIPGRSSKLSQIPLKFEGGYLFV